VIIREASIEDADVIIELWKEFIDFHGVRDEAFRRSHDGHEQFGAYVRKNIVSEEWLVLVAVENGKLIGYCTATVAEYPPVLERARYGFIQDIAVTETCRGQGVGTRFVTRAELWFRRRGITRIQLHVASANEVSQAFWNRLGFKEYMRTLTREFQRHG